MNQHPASTTPKCEQHVWGRTTTGRNANLKTFFNTLQWQVQRSQTGPSDLGGHIIVIAVEPVARKRETSPFSTPQNIIEFSGTIFWFCTSTSCYMKHWLTQQHRKRLQAILSIFSWSNSGCFMGWPAWNSQQNTFGNLSHSIVICGRKSIVIWRFHHCGRKS